MSTAVPARSSARNVRTHYLVLGFGVVSATGYLLYQRKVYADAHSDWHPQQPDSPLPPLGLAPGVRGIACAQTTASGEDRISINYYPFSSTLGYLAIGVYDGHSGARTAVQLNHVLSDAVIGALADLYSEHAQKHAAMDVASGVYLPAPGALPNPIPPDAEIDDTIRMVFVAVDNVCVHEAARTALGLDDAAYAALQACNTPDAAADVLRPAAGAPPHHLQESVRALSAAWSGSCALLGLFNVDDRSLRVALTGDSRAVLGGASPPPPALHLRARPLTADQTALNPAEAARLTALHPDEPELLKNGRVVGWGPARAFGDGAMKWSRAVQAQLHEKVFGDKPRDACRTPPYFTAEPVVRRFVVFATDGLWDCLTSEEVVGLVGRWLEDRGTDATAVDETGERTSYASLSTSTHRWNPIGALNPLPPRHHQCERHNASKTYLPSELPVILPPGYEDKTTMYKWWRAEKNLSARTS
ncbi:phosphatase 2C-like domain-containing protein [Pholiota molesta]|nr:phosphatase 2C-like domain-containing protein [Pholiota molesta]